MTTTKPKHITIEQAEAAIDEIGETGSAKVVRDVELWTRREENCDWLFCGAVDVETGDHEALIALVEAFHGRGYGDAAS